MSTTELICRLRDISRVHYISNQEQSLLSAAADRLEVLQRISTPIPELAHGYPLVLYLKTKADRDELLELFKQEHPNFVAREL